MKGPRHHDNRGRRQIQRGKTHRQVECLARRLGAVPGLIYEWNPQTESYEPPKPCWVDEAFVDGKKGC